MWQDPIVKEIREFREAHAADFNYDIRAIVEDARKRQEHSKDRIVSFVRAREQTPLRK